MSPLLAMGAFARAAHITVKSPTARLGNRMFASSTDATTHVGRPLAKKTTWELWRSLLVFRVCTIQPVVKHADRIIAAFDSIGLSSLSNLVIKYTFYNQFCAGETPKEIKSLIDSYQANGIRTLLEYAYESDIESQKSGGMSPGSSSVVKALADTIDYAALGKDSFTAIKITALLDPQVLERISNVCNRIQASFFASVDLERTPSLSAAHSKSDLVRVLSSLLDIPAQEAAVLADTLFPKSSTVDWVDFSSVVTPSNPVLRGHLSKLAIKDETLASAADLDALDRTLEHTKALCTRSKQLGVWMAVDAEFYYCQPAIDHISRELERIFNKPSQPGDLPLVHNTLQCYRKDALWRLSVESERARRLGYALGIKAVRGAYVVHERARAKTLGTPDPVWPTIEGTHWSYNTIIQLMLEKIASGTNAGLVIAGHNEESVRRAREKMAELGIENDSPRVRFGQLQGMMDHLTLSLANDRYRAMKATCQGPVNVCIPYLIRRAQENSSALAGAGRELHVIWSELKARRLFF
ncbi:FAD-linked oxidoreductase-like protein [Polychytrium aggregatum]|uniref:FAD-linked oxidoreductase-like protein n=1 Tax=Polychytrium aggregatum TaxID=110093 RepID=UPI0022FDBA8D|nr:FAD-linked oxidoreductase-like protein [Polychytrium aggregatum]KAI9209246.1 FAD-linked oxidoreductase-like protein [Polychytrium aggregatum]